MQHYSSQQESDKGSTQSINPDRIKIVPKLPAPALGYWQADCKQGPKMNKAGVAENNTLIPA